LNALSFASEFDEKQKAGSRIQKKGKKRESVEAVLSLIFWLLTPGF
jgi:hypothetical protein